MYILQARIQEFSSAGEGGGVQPAEKKRQKGREGSASILL